MFWSLFKNPINSCLLNLVSTTTFPIFDTQALNMSTKLTLIRFSSASPFFLPLFLIWLMDRQIAPDATDRYRPWAWGVTRKRVWFVTLTPIHRRQASSKHYIIMPLSLLHEYIRGWAVGWKRVGLAGRVGNGPLAHPGHNEEVHQILSHWLQSTADKHQASTTL